MVAPLRLRLVFDGGGSGDGFGESPHGGGVSLDELRERLGG